MGDPTKFQNIIQYSLFNGVFIMLLLSEMWIFLTTFQKGNEKKKRDKGTRWVLVCCFLVSIFISVYSVSQSVPEKIRMVILPEWTGWIGIFLIIFGVVLRQIAVRTLKKAFTLNVQTTDSQQLITSGVYHVLRNPSYTGSIISLLGVAASYRNMIAMILVLCISIVCYAARIHTEETALTERFGDEFLQYTKNTWRLFPHVW